MDAKQMGEALKEGNRMGYRGRSAGLITGIMAVTTGLALLGLTLLIGLLAGRDVFKETPIAALRDV